MDRHIDKHWMNEEMNQKKMGNTKTSPLVRDILHDLWLQDLLSLPRAQKFAYCYQNNADLVKV